MSPVLFSFGIVGAFIAGLSFAVVIERRMQAEWRCGACGNKIGKGKK